jgi:hypothetical protein
VPSDGENTSNKVTEFGESSLSQVNGAVGALRASIIDSNDDALATAGDLDLLSTPGALAVEVTVLRSVLK